MSTERFLVNRQDCAGDISKVLTCNAGLRQNISTDSSTGTVGNHILVQASNSREKNKRECTASDNHDPEIATSLCSKFSELMQVVTILQEKYHQHRQLKVDPTEASLQDMKTVRLKIDTLSNQVTSLGGRLKL